MFKKKCRHQFESFHILYPSNNKSIYLVIQKMVANLEFCRKNNKILISLNGCIEKGKTMIKNKHKHSFFLKNQDNLVTFQSANDNCSWRL